MALGLLRGAFSVKRSPLHDIQLASSDFAQRVTAPVHGLLTWIDSAALGACQSAPTRFRHSLTRRALKSKFPILSRLYTQVKGGSKNALTWLHTADPPNTPFPKATRRTTHDVIRRAKS